MKKQLKKWSLRLTAATLLMAGLLIGIVLNPSLLYAHETIVGNFKILHQKPIDNHLIQRVKNIESLLKKCELYDVHFKMEICLNDGSLYPDLMQKLRGRAFAWGFYDKVVLQGYADYQNNYISLNRFRWNLEQLLVHEAVHCLQFNRFGFWGSNPIAGYPNWKWEGYPEYVSRQSKSQQDLFDNIQRIADFDQHQSWAVEFADRTISPIHYYQDWLLMQYCLDIKGLSYEEVLNDTTDEAIIHTAMMQWYEQGLQ